MTKRMRRKSSLRKKSTLRKNVLKGRKTMRRKTMRRKTMRRKTMRRKNTLKRYTGGKPKGPPPGPPPSRLRSGPSVPRRSQAIELEPPRIGIEERPRELRPTYETFEAIISDGREFPSWTQANGKDISMEDNGKARRDISTMLDHLESGVLRLVFERLGFGTIDETTTIDDAALDAALIGNIDYQLFSHTSPEAARYLSAGNIATKATIGLSKRVNGKDLYPPKYEIMFRYISYLVYEVTGNWNHVESIAGRGTPPLWAQPQAGDQVSPPE